MKKINKMVIQRMVMKFINRKSKLILKFSLILFVLRMVIWFKERVKRRKIETVAEVEAEVKVVKEITKIENEVDQDQKIVNEVAIDVVVDQKRDLKVDHVQDQEKDDIEREDDQGLLVRSESILNGLTCF